MATLTDTQAQLLLDKNFGSFAVLNEDGSPTVTPVWVDWDGEYVLVNTLRARAKPRQVERDPRVEIAVMNRENPYQHVRIAGTAELTTEGTLRSTSTSCPRSTWARTATRGGSRATSG